ncbi:SDR family NAD(P)-dependent oxidoreductase [Streptomyces sp. NPDC012623]|uniref:SDR family NAD(P)-dependent oxidoreductase n=1 Tax=unclassified Streptomyces TaxID=2593676 RepID=UPI0036C8C449
MDEEQATQYRNVLVIGGTSGLGQEVARQFAPLAQKVFITYHGRRDEAEKTAAAVREAGGTPEIRQLSLPNTDTGGSRIRDLLLEVSPCDAVVNCAVTNEAAVATISNAAAFKSVIDANVFGTYQINAICAQTLASTGGGSVVNVSSILTRRYITGAIGYITSKAAIEMMTRGFAREWARLGVRFNTVSPGPIRDTKLLNSVPLDVFADVMGPDFEERLMPPEKVAAVIRRITGPDFAAMNGEVVTVDEGASL